jgi:hypothetical protein
MQDGSTLRQTHNPDFSRAERSNNKIGL